MFDENARKEFLTGFRKRKDERRKQWKEKIDRQLKNEIKKIKNDTKAKVCMEWPTIKTLTRNLYSNIIVIQLEKGALSKKNSSHHIVPEVAHLINSDAASTMVSRFGFATFSSGMMQVKDIGGASVSITTLDSLKKPATPWHDNVNTDDSSEDGEESEEDEEEVPGMSLKKKEEEVVPFKVGDKERKAINRLYHSIRFSLFTDCVIFRMAVSQLHKSKAFKAKEALKAKKQRNAARWKKGKKEGKRKQHAKKFAKPKD